MHHRPLPALPTAMYPGVRAFLERARRAGIRVAMFSDYPAERKLAALGLTEYFEVVASAFDPDIDAFKPSPKGLLRVLEVLRVPPEEAVYVGDRPEVDGEAARRAGLHAWILCSKGVPAPPHWSAFQSFDQLSRLLGICVARN